MKTLFALLVAADLPMAGYSQTNTFTPTNPPPQNVADAFATLSSWLAANNPSLTNFYAEKEIDLKLGGVYSQATGEAGALLDVTDWGLIGKNFGLGVAAIEGNKEGMSGTAATYFHVSYRKVIGNVAASIFTGPGYDFEQKHVMGVAGAEVEYRWTKNFGSFVSGGYEIAGANREKRGLILSGGLKYSF